jgi:membrane-associated phospholipid phosphatase
VFGSQQDANHASDILRSTLVASTIVTGLATPSGTTQSEIIANKSKGLLTEYAILETTSAATGQIKRGTGRERPNGLNNSSFPSGHTSKAFAAAALTSKNLDSLPISSSSAQTIRLGLYTVACGTGLARVEANMHYLTDVMAGAALGNFLSRFIHDAFLGLDDINHQLVIEISSHYSYLDLSWNF